MIDQLVALLSSHEHLDPDTARLLLCDHVAPLMRSAGYLRAEYGFRIAWGHAGDDGVCCVLHEPVIDTHGELTGGEHLYNVAPERRAIMWAGREWARKALPEELADAERAMAVVRINLEDATAWIAGELRPTSLPAEVAVELPERVCNALASLGAIRAEVCWIGSEDDANIARPRAWDSSGRELAMPAADEPGGSVTRVLCEALDEAYEQASWPMNQICRIETNQGGQNRLKIDVAARRATYESRLGGYRDDDQGLWMYEGAWEHPEPDAASWPEGRFELDIGPFNPSAYEEERAG
jgi:hypothetical protein